VGNPQAASLTVDDTSKSVDAQSSWTLQNPDFTAPFTAVEGEIPVKAPQFLRYAYIS
jgi:hypothetical protein